MTSEISKLHPENRELDTGFFILILLLSNKEYDERNDSKRKLKRPEILAPAGTLEKLKPRSIMEQMQYIGGNAYGLRSRAGNLLMKKWLKELLLQRT